MPAHVIYPRVDSRPAGFSPVWQKEILRNRLCFGGIVVSDDLSMEGASVAGGIVDRARAALGAGCDMILVCNARDATLRLLDGLGDARLDPVRATRIRGPRVAHGATPPGYQIALAEVFRERAAGTLV